MKRAFLWIVLLFTSIIAASCSASASAVPVTETVKISPPTVTVLPSDTAVPTAAHPVILEDITGIWTREDIERGTLFLIISEDSTFIAAHGSPSGVVHSGTYSFIDGIFIFTAGWDCSPTEGDVPGQYTLKLLADGQYLYFYPIEDACPDRPAALKGFRWHRVTGTPAP